MLENENNYQNQAKSWSRWAAVVFNDQKMQQQMQLLFWGFWQRRSKKAALCFCGFRQIIWEDAKRGNMKKLYDWVRSVNGMWMWMKSMLKSAWGPVATNVRNMSSAVHNTLNTSIPWAGNTRGSWCFWRLWFVALCWKLQWRLWI